MSVKVIDYPFGGHISDPFDITNALREIGKDIARKNEPAQNEESATFYIGRLSSKKGNFYIYNESDYRQILEPTILKFSALINAQIAKEI
jgi:hypothetical protein